MFRLAAFTVLAVCPGLMPLAIVAAVSVGTVTYLAASGEELPKLKLI